MPAPTGHCGSCHAPLARAVVRVVRQFEDTHLLRVTCSACEEAFFAVYVRAPTRPVTARDVAVAAASLQTAQRLGDIFDLSALDLSDAA